MCPYPLPGFIAQNGAKVKLHAINHKLNGHLSYIVLANTRSEHGGSFQLNNQSYPRGADALGVLVRNAGMGDIGSAFEPKWILK